MSAYSVAAVACAVAVIFFIIGFFVGEAEIKVKVEEVLHHYDRYKSNYISVEGMRRLLRHIVE